jgi:dinuclear metal center YbgI/SA1388 family protein
METIKVKDVARYLETVAPRSFQENYDNSGLLTGDPAWTVKGILVTLDCVEAIVDEAVQRGYNMIVAHHPIIFKGLKKLTGQNYVERTVIKAIRNDIALYSIHTNLDNVITGVNRKIANKLGLKNVKILVPKKDSLLKLVTFVPKENAASVLTALHDAGAGNIGDYKNCSFQTSGTGSFLPGINTDPHIGKKGELERTEEVRIEVILPRHAEKDALVALRKAHPYEEVAYYLTALENENQEVGAGMIGELEVPEEPIAFLKRLKICMNTSCVRFTAPGNRQIQKVAICGGSGSFLLKDAIWAGADAFVSADFKYHEFFDADGKILVADIGHYESESFTKDLLNEVLREKFPNFAINFSEQVTNPISYL